MTRRQKNSALLFAAALGTLATACVHTDTLRTGRMRLGDGREGSVPVVASTDGTFAEVAVIRVSADGIDTEARRERHLRRQGSLLGCDAITALRHDIAASTATCVRRTAPVATVALDVIDAPTSLVARLRTEGEVGRPLLKVLAQSARSEGEARAWPLRWYLEQYPESPFRADVEALFVARDAAPQIAAVLPPTTVRTAPTLE